MFELGKTILQGLGQGGILSPMLYVCFIVEFINLFFVLNTGRNIRASSADDELLKMAVSEEKILTNYCESVFFIPVNRGMGMDL